MTAPTKTAAYLVAFTDEGTHTGSMTCRTRADWQRNYREARERAGPCGTIMMAAARTAPLTGKLLAVAATFTAIRKTA